ncbi:virulence factor BrkB family protein [Amphritea sp. 1_MG-2023]|uniref:virulence factor BrkB family protein n=1 Tax=Amphritea sp. 1_MG-2023 TaxID=3062670 RepID=UPI0026E3DCCE|nr:virulence factor BrkB family protein [Amphritea sp. 1_MG-2023]MDO6562281.1 virulence factor BrkB family protein [Amphritea sp. 1_MG-2023]
MKGNHLFTLRGIGYFLLYLARQFVRNKGMLNASALTYTTLFAVVPLMTVSYAMLAAIPSFQGAGEQLQGLIFDNFVPATGAVVQDYLSDFAAQASKLTAVGLIFLFVTSIMMMKNIEGAFNRIWRVSEPRKGMSSFLLYWAVLSLGPLLIGLGLLVSSYIASLSLFTSATELVGRARLLSVLPLVMSAAAFTLLYAAVPNCKVPLKNAVIGGVVVAILFETAKRAFALFVTQFPSYELIYGAFAAVPLFLAWIFISWMIILLGAELSRALSVYRDQRKGKHLSHLHTLVAVLQHLWQAQQSGESLSDRQLLQRVEGLEQNEWDHYNVLLLQASVMSRTERGEYMLARDMGSFTLDQLNSLLPWPLPEKSPVESVTLWQRQLDQRLQQLSDVRKQQLNVTLEQLFEADIDRQADMVERQADASEQQ